MPVHILADDQGKLPILRAMLEGRHAVTTALLGPANLLRRKIASIVVAADVTDVDNIAALKAISDQLGRIPRRIFLINGKGRLSVVQAYALGATHVLCNPVRQNQLLAKLADVESRLDPRGVESGGSHAAASAASASIAAMFAAVMDGTAVDIAGTRDAGNQATRAIGIVAWRLSDPQPAILRVDQRLVQTAAEPVSKHPKRILNQRNAPPRRLQTLKQHAIESGLAGYCLDRGTHHARVRNDARSLVGELRQRHQRIADQVH